MSKVALVVASLLVAGCSLYALKAQPPASGPSGAAPHERAFAGQILVISLKSDPDTCLIVEKPSIRRNGGKEFLVGVCVDDGEEDEWRGGLTVWTAMDDVSQIVEVRDRKDLEERMGGCLDGESKGTRT